MACGRGFDSPRFHHLQGLGRPPGPFSCLRREAVDGRIQADARRAADGVGKCFLLLALSRGVAAFDGIRLGIAAPRSGVGLGGPALLAAGALSLTRLCVERPDHIDGWRVLHGQRDILALMLEPGHAWRLTLFRPFAAPCQPMLRYFARKPSAWRATKSP